MEIDSIDNELIFGDVTPSTHQLPFYQYSQWKGRNVRKVSGDSLEIAALVDSTIFATMPISPTKPPSVVPSAPNPLQPSSTHLPTIASLSPPRTEAVVDRSNQEIQIANEVRETYRKYSYSSEELEKVVQWALKLHRVYLPASPTTPPIAAQSTPPRTEAVVDRSNQKIQGDINRNPPKEPSYLQEVAAAALHAGTKTVGLAVDGMLGLTQAVNPTVLHPKETIQQAWQDRAVPSLHEKIDNLCSTNMAENFDPKKNPTAVQIVESILTNPIGVLNLEQAGIKAAQVLSNAPRMELAAAESTAGIKAATAMPGRVSAIEEVAMASRQAVPEKIASVEAQASGKAQKIIKSEPIATVGVEAEISASTQVGRKDVPNPTDTQKIKVPIRTEPRNLHEQLVLKDAQAGGGVEIDELKINDPRFSKEIWMKKQCIQYTSDGKQINVHYWENRLTGERTGFKFKNE